MRGSGPATARIADELSGQHTWDIEPRAHDGQWHAIQSRGSEIGAFTVRARKGTGGILGGGGLRF